MAKIYHVDLTDEEGESLLHLIGKGKPSARKVTRARILLLADEGKLDRDIQEALHTSRSRVERTRKRFVEGNLEYALTEKKRSGVPRKFDGDQEAYLGALACSPPPSGRVRWTLQLLSDKLVELKVVEVISREVVRLRLKKTR